MATEYWLNYVPYLYRPDGNAQLSSRDSGQVSDLFTEVGFRLERALPGRSWLRRAFSDELSVSLWTRLEQCTDVRVVGTEVDTDRGMPAVICRLAYPAAWFQQPVDGRTAVRLIYGALVGLRALANVYHLGAIGVRSVREDRRRPEGLGLFDGISYRDERLALEELAHRYGELAEGQGLLCAPVVADRGLSRRQAAVVRRLGGRELVEHAAPLPNGAMVRSWVLEVPL